MDNRPASPVPLLEGLAKNKVLFITGKASCMAKKAKIPRAQTDRAGFDRHRPYLNVLQATYASDEGEDDQGDDGYLPDIGEGFDYRN